MILDLSFGQMPLYFIENQGQVDRQVIYYVKGDAKNIYFTSTGLTLVLQKKANKTAQLFADSAQGMREDTKTPLKETCSRWVVKLDFLGARPDAVPEGLDPATAKISYFRGRPGEWKTGLPTFSRIRYRELWPGIDLVYSGTVTSMKYEFIVRPGADPARIRLAYRGARSVTLTSSGRLKVETPAGGFEDVAPVGYQEVNGKRVAVDLDYMLEDDPVQNTTGEYTREYGFKVGGYDPGLPLVLDPMVLVYCGFIGGSLDDRAYGIAIDGGGNAYVTGEIYSSEVTFPVTVGPDLTQNGDYDAFVAKVNAAGTGLVYCGFLGGTGLDVGRAIAVNNGGVATITGYTWSGEATFPVTVGPDLTHNGDFDAFVARVNAAGTGLDYCGYLGGSFGDYGRAIAVDGSGNAFVTGHTFSDEATFPVAVGPDLTHNGRADAFVARVNAAGTGLDYCGYLGGSSLDYGMGIAVGNGGVATIAGYTLSSEATFPVAVGPDLTHNGDYDAFVASVKPVGDGLWYCGYIGGSSADIASGIALATPYSAVYVTGHTYSDETTFPVAVGPDLTHNGGADAFVAKVYSTGLYWCGYIGGSGIDESSAIAVDALGRTYVTGVTSSAETSFPVCNGPDLTHNGSKDAFVARVLTTGAGLDYCGYIGGSEEDHARGIATDGWGNVYVTGYTGSSENTFPVTVGPDLTHNGFYDAFLTKISEGFQISGTVTDFIGTITGVAITFSHDGHIAKTSADGTYAYLVPKYVTTTLTPSHPEYVNWDPATITVESIGSDQPGQDFIGQFNIGSLELAAPDGGEVWNVGEVHHITWVSWDISGQVHLEYSIDNGSNWADIAAAADNDGTYAWTIPDTPSTQCRVRISDAADNYPTDTSNATFTIFAVVPPEISLNRSTLLFGAESGLHTQNQNVLVSNGGGGTLSWTATDDQTWLGVSPAAGTGAAKLTVSVDATGMDPGTYTGTVTVSDSAATNSPQTVAVTLKVYTAGGSGAPFGSFATPVDQSTVQSSISVSGWALDDIEVVSVKIWREPLTGEPTHPNGFVLIGDAVFVEGARPDLETSYSSYPLNYRGGWGYMLCTYGLPDQGMSATYTLHAIATDKEGNTTDLGTKTITCDNQNAVKPFGAIATPAQGGEASGAAYRNWGWALTPPPNMIPTDGSTMRLLVDGAPVGYLNYNLYRADVAALFPECLNSDGAAAYYDLDTTVYANGVHTIAWIAVDNAGNADGIGSRFFNVVNTSAPDAVSATSNQTVAPLTLEKVKAMLSDPSPVRVKRHLSPDGPGALAYPAGEQKEISITTNIAQGITLDLNPDQRPGAHYTGYLKVGDELRPLPVGSTLDAEYSIFYWQPGPGFIGQYNLVFVDDNHKLVKRIRVTVR